MFEKPSEIKGQNKALSELKDFITNFPKNGKAALLYGKTGTGKTSSVYALAKELNYEVMEMNASDYRNKDSMESIIGSASKQRSLLYKSKIILIDEVDGLSGTKDRGAIPSLISLINKSSYPIVLTANDPFEQKFSALRKKVKMIPFRTLSYLTIASILRDICKKESIEYEEKALQGIAIKSEGDARAAIIDLFILSAGKKKIKANEINNLFDRRREVTIIEAITRILKTTDFENALSSLDDIDEDFDEVFLWLDENLPKEYKKTEDIFRAYESLSRADVFRGRITKWQYWRFLVYVHFFISVGVALAKKEKYRGFTKIERPGRLLKIWISNRKNNTKNKIAEKLAVKTHTSKKTAFNIVPFLQILAADEDLLIKIADELELDEKEKEWLKAKSYKLVMNS